MIDWLICWLIDWLIDWLVGWLLTLVMQQKCSIANDGLTCDWCCRLTRWYRTLNASTRQVNCLWSRPRQRWCYGSTRRRGQRSKTCLTALQMKAKKSSSEFVSRYVLSASRYTGNLPVLVHSVLRNCRLEVRAGKITALATFVLLGDLFGQVSGSSQKVESRRHEMIRSTWNINYKIYNSAVKYTTLSYLTY